jgi:deoxyribose-phosphate aldolase
MFDFSRLSDQRVAEQVRKEAQAFMARCHFGTQGVVKTEADVRAACKKLLDSGFRAIAFDTEMNYVPLARDLLSGSNPLHAAVAYPMGRMTVSQKVRDLERLVGLGVSDTCVCLDWQAIFSHRWRDLEKEAALLTGSTKGMFACNALVIPATLMSDTEIIEACTALDAAGTISVKVNPGVKLWVSFEEVELIQRRFPGRFDVHPSGGITSLAEVERYLELGCNVIHSIKSLEITEEFVAKRLRGSGVLTNG